LQMSTSGQIGTFGIQPGQTIDEYKIIGKIGKGGMAMVYKAYQPSMDRYVAIKILSFQLIDNEEFLGRFKQESRMIARLEHPNILPIYAYGEDHGIPYLVTRYLNAGTLRDYLRSKIMPPASKTMPPAKNPQPGLNPPPLPLKETDSIFTQVAGALSYAHDNGVLHRDIKPSNIMLDQRGSSTTALLTDFGIAKFIEIAGGSQETIPQFTATGAITGTPDYMSPEQAQGQHLDPRSDIYSLGVVLFEMLTGKVPFDAETPIAVIMKQISEPPPLPSSFNPKIHPALEEVVVKALDKSPDARYTSTAAFLSAWKKALAVAIPPAIENAVGLSAAGGQSLQAQPGASEGEGSGRGITEPDQRDTPTPTPPFIFHPEELAPDPALPRTVTPAGGALHALEDDSFPRITPPKVDTSRGGISEVAHGGGSEAPRRSLSTAPPLANTRSSLNTLDEDNKFLLKNLQLSKTVSANASLAKNGSPDESAQTQQSSRRILLIAGGVALAILVIISLAAALKVFDLLNEVRQIPLGSIPGMSG
jgi:serine/threonine protein kinase